MARLDKRLVDLAVRHPKIMGALNYSAGQMLGDATLAANFKYDSYAALLGGVRGMAEFSDLVDFSRVGGGGRFNASGLYEWQSSGPRFDYDPVTLAAKGLLIEGQATNLVASSNNLPATLNVTSVANSFVGIDGLTTVGKLAETAVSGEHFSSVASITSSVGGTVTVSVIVYPPTGSAAERFIGLRISSAIDIGIVFDRTTGNHSVVAGSATVVKQSLGGGRWRVSMSTIATTAGTSTFRVRLYSTISTVNYLGDPTTWAVIGNIQVEKGPLTSFVPTSGSSVTRSADYVNLPLGPWYNASAGTLLLYHDVPSGSPLVASGANDLLTSGGAGLSVLAWDSANIYRSNLGAAYDTVANPGISDSFKLLRNGADTLWANAHVSKILAFPRKLTVAEALAA